MTKPEKSSFSRAYGFPAATVSRKDSARHCFPKKSIKQRASARDDRPEAVHVRDMQIQCAGQHFEHESLPSDAAQVPIWTGTAALSHTPHLQPVEENPTKHAFAMRG